MNRHWLQVRVPWCFFARSRPHSRSSRRVQQTHAHSKPIENTCSTTVNCNPLYCPLSFSPSSYSLISWRTLDLDHRPGFLAPLLVCEVGTHTTHFAHRTRSPTISTHTNNHIKIRCELLRNKHYLTLHIRVPHRLVVLSLASQSRHA